MKHSTASVCAAVMAAAATNEVNWYVWLGLVVSAAVIGFLLDKAVEKYRGKS